MHLKKILWLYGALAIPLNVSAMEWFKSWFPTSGKVEWLKSWLPGSGQKAVEKAGGAQVRFWGKENQKACPFAPCPAEKEYLKQRKNTAEQAIGKVLSAANFDTKNIKKYPCLAICASGGGMRAMYAFDAALRSLAKNGLLDTISYAATLSGSTWVLAPWLVSGKADFLAFEPDFIKQVREKNRWEHFKMNVTNIIETMRKLVQNWSLSTVYAGKLGRSLFGKKEKWENLMLGSLASKLADGKLPLPIFTAVMVSPNLWENAQMFELTRETAYWWCDMTPFEAACYDFCAAVPIDRFNCLFEAGKELESNRKAFNLVDIIGFCSSAFALTLAEYGIISPESWFGQFRFVARNAANPVYQLQGCPEKSAIGQQTLPIIDAGICFNIPLPPLLHRDQAEPLDLIIVIDVTGTIPKAQALFRAKQYAKAKGLRFPSIDSHSKYQEQPFTLFGDPTDPDDLMLLYIPLVENPLYEKIAGKIDELFAQEKKKKESEEESDGGADLVRKFKSISTSSADEDDKTYQNLLQDVDNIIRANGLQKNDYNAAMKIVQDMRKFKFERADAGFMGKGNFDYTEEEQAKLQTVFTVALTQAHPTIIDAIKKRTAALNGKALSKKSEKVVEEGEDKEEEIIKKEDKEKESSEFEEEWEE
ncbi:MAG: hypothetical protein M1549_03595 [Candidatus Dependentiae bacterium]|nr:hypothetical protein [Candidatus Dependentiae bacterium]